MNLKHLAVQENKMVIELRGHVKRTGANLQELLPLTKSGLILKSK